MSTNQELDNKDDDSVNNNDSTPIMESCTVRVDDGGSDLTNRFKYKVNALMGAFDPADASVDNERNTGHILNAMLKFPIEYTFNVVGNTASKGEAVGENAKRSEFIDQVRYLVQEGTGEGDEHISIRVTPRGKRFTKLAITVKVQSSDMIASIYNGLNNIEMCVMQF